MNPSINPKSDTPALIESASKPKEEVHWLRHILARNPFYILSAALLLYSMRRLSFDSRIFPDEISQLMFNFSSFHFYEILLVITAIFLARRHIWYDSGLLIGLENLFLFVPFILVSQALMVEGPIAIVFCTCGCALVISRMISLNRFVPSIYLPKKLLSFGAILLALNLALPIVTRLLHKNSNLDIWDSRRGMLDNFEWFAIAPLAMLLSYFLPITTNISSDTRAKAAFFSGRYFPLLTFALWITGTIAHLYCIGFVYGSTWKISLLLPSLWIVAWILWKRRFAFVFPSESLRAFAEKCFFCLPVIILAIAIFERDWRICFSLSLLNLIAYAVITIKNRSDQWASHLLLVSAALVVASVPQSLIHTIAMRIMRPQLVCISFFGYLLVLTMLSRSPKAGIFGAVLAPVFFQNMFPNMIYGQLSALIQIAIVFLLLHSLRWNDPDHVGSNIARNLAVSFWIIQSLWWFSDDPTTARASTFAAALVLIAAYFLARLISGSWGPKVLPYSAITVAGLTPLYSGAQLVRHAPSGILFLVISFGLFAIGTLTALRKSRQNSEKQFPPTAVEPNTNV